jgi:agmatine deiminase
MSWRIPSEFEPHNRTWMAWPWDAHIWNRIPATDLARAQETIESLALLISKYEKVSLLVPRDFKHEIDSRLKGDAEQHCNIETIAAEYSDIWVRDTLPTFAISDSNRLIAIDWRFNGWGRRIRAYGRDTELARRVAALADARIINSGITAEGGAFAFDGNGLLVATKSVMFDKHRNYRDDKSALENALLNASRCTSICWLPGDRSEPVTVGHADGILAFGPKNIVFFHWVADETGPEYDICDYNLRVFQDWAAAEKRCYEIVRLVAPNHQLGESWCTSYVNFSIVNGAIIVPTLGKEFSAENEAARYKIAAAFDGGIKVEMLDIRYIAAAGGGIHCATCNEPAIVQIEPS